MAPISLRPMAGAHLLTGHTQLLKSIRCKIYIDSLPLRIGVNLPLFEKCETWFDVNLWLPYISTMGKSMKTIFILGMLFCQRWITQAYQEMFDLRHMATIKIYSDNGSWMSFIYKSWSHLIFHHVENKSNSSKYGYLIYIWLIRIFHPFQFLYLF